MTTTKAKKELKLNARKTSLSQKTNEQLIDIILKKDNTERKNNVKIANLHQNVRDLELALSTKDKTIAELESKINELQKSNETTEIEIRHSRLYKFIAIILGGVLMGTLLIIVF